MPNENGLLDDVGVGRHLNVRVSTELLIKLRHAKSIRRVKV